MSFYFINATILSRNIRMLDILQKLNCKHLHSLYVILLWLL